MNEENSYINFEENEAEQPQESGEQENAGYETGNEMEMDDGQGEPVSYYSMEELENLTDEDELDMDRIPPAMQKMFDRMQKQSSTQNIPQFNVSDELSLEQVSVVRQQAINDVALWLQQQGIEYNEMDVNHTQLVQEQQKNLIKKARVQQRQINMANAIDTDLRGKYGKNFDAINSIAMKYINDEISASKQREINQRIRNGDTKIVYQIYEQASKKYFANNPVRTKKTVFPPHSISGGTKQSVKNQQNKINEDYFM